MHRSKSVDTARGLAVILMITYHVMVWLVAPADRTTFFRALQILATYFAPATFFLLTGASLAFSYIGRRSKGQPTGEITKHVLKRYGGLIAIGITLNMVIWSPRSFWIWDVLEMIGLCNIIAYFLLLFQSDLVLLAGAAAGLSFYVVLMNIPIPHYVGLIIDNPLLGGFALGPFLCFTIIGVVSGKRMVAHNSVCSECFAAGVALVLLSIALHFLGVPIDRYPPSVSYVAFASGITILVVGALFWWQDVKDFAIPAGRFINIYGRNALNIYIGHYLVYRVYRFMDIGSVFHFWPSLAATFVIILIIPGIIILLGSFVGFLRKPPQDDTKSS